MMKILHILLILVLLYVLTGILFYIFQNRILFFPQKLPKDFKYHFTFPFEELFIKTHDNKKVNALYFKKQDTRGVILYFHGNAGSLASWGWIAADFQSFPYDLMIMDYRTYGKSDGPLTEENLYKDAEACYQFIRQRYPEDQIAIYGRSIGTAIAVDLASKTNPARLILESPFCNLPQLARHHFPVLPYALLTRYRFDSCEKAEQIKCPVYILHGTNDNIIPIKFGEKFAGLLPSWQVKFTPVEQAGHNDLGEYDEYRRKLTEILK